MGANRQRHHAGQSGGNGDGAAGDAGLPDIHRGSCLSHFYSKRAHTVSSAGNLSRRREKNSKRNSMGFQHLAGAAYRALTARKDGPSLYDVCDPVLLNPGRGDPHLCKFYRTALGNPALRPLLRRTGLAELREEGRLERLRQALIAARDDAAPDWAAIGQPVAALLDTVDLGHPSPKPAPVPQCAPGLGEIEGVIGACGAHLLRSFAQNGFIPTYAAFNLTGA